MSEKALFELVTGRIVVSGAGVQMSLYVTLRRGILRKARKRRKIGGCVFALLKQCCVFQ